MPLTRFKSKWLILVGIVAAVAAVFLVPNLLNAGKQKKLVEASFQDYANALMARDYARAYDFTSDEFKKAVPFETYAERRRELETEFGPLKSISQEQTYVHGKGSPMRWIAIIEAHEKYKKTELVSACELHLERGAWRVFGCKQIGQA